VISGIFNAFSGMVSSAKKLQNSANNLVGLEKNKVPFGEIQKTKPDLNSTEASTVSISKEKINQLTAKAEFNANAKAIVVADETIGTILDLKT
jgi:flagellar hook protein FlgE